jgi:hypothetical protein
VVAEIRAANPTWVDRKGEERPVDLDDILIIAPYNALEFDLRDRAGLIAAGSGNGRSPEGELESRL